METVGKTYMAVAGLEGTAKDHVHAAVGMGHKIIEVVERYIFIESAVALFGVVFLFDVPPLLKIRCQCTVSSLKRGRKHPAWDQRMTADRVPSVG